MIDDGSTDDTLNVARSYAGKDSRVRVFTQENKGVSAARNHGIREARGEYMTLLDSDDWMEDDAVEVLLEAQLQHPGRMVAANFYSVEVSGNGNSFIRLCSWRKTKPEDLTAEEALSLDKPSVFHFPHAKMYSLSRLREYGLSYSEDVHYGEDMLFNFRYIVRSGGMFYISRPCCNVLKRLGSATHIPYSKRKIFAGGKFNDYIQMMIDDPCNTPTTRRLMKLQHARRMAL